VFYPPLLLTPEATQRAVPPELFSILLGETTRTYNFSSRIIQHFSARAGYRIAQGNIDGAIDDTISILRWSRYVARTGTLIQYIIGFAFEERARTIPIGGNPEHPLTEQQIRRFLAELDALPPHRPFTEAVEWDRHMVLSWAQLMSIGDTQGASPAQLLSALSGLELDSPYLMLSGFNWNVVFRRINEVYDAVQEPLPRATLDSILNEIGEPPSGRGAMIGRVLYSFLIPGGKDTLLADTFTAILAPVAAIQIEQLQRYGCADNLQRLALAILLYQLEHGTVPGENWAEQIAEYLGEDAEQYFSCPANPSPEGFTSYALVQYGVPPGDAVAGSLLLIELTEPVPMGEAVISVDEVLARQRTGSLHPGGMNVAHRSGAVQFLSSHVGEAELLRLLGQETE